MGSPTHPRPSNTMQAKGGPKRYLLDDYVATLVKKKHLTSEFEYRNGLAQQREKPQGSNKAGPISLRSAEGGLRPPTFRKWLQL